MKQVYGPLPPLPAFDLAPCQACGSAARMHKNNVARCYVECANIQECSVQGPCKNFPPNSYRYWVPTDEVATFYQAAVAWNEMQRYIARGKLLDEEPKQTTKARL